MENENTTDAVLAHDLPPARHKTWALVDGGFVTHVKRTYDHLMHPFGDAADGRIVLDVTGTDCAPGYLVDHKGNVTAAGIRTAPLMPHEPAYHDRSNPAAPHIVETAAAVTTSEPHPVSTDAGEDHRDAADAAEIKAEHPTAGLVQEHGVVQGEIKPDDQPG